MRFRFSYAPLLERCEQAEAACRDTVVQLRARAADARDRLAACERRRDDACRALGIGDAGALARYRFLVDSVSAAHAAAVSSQTDVSRALASYLDARRETRRMTVLRERAAAHVMRDAARRAERELDEANAAASLSFHERTSV